MNEKTVGSILRQELKRRQEKNPKYSLRSFARDLSLSRTALSDVINNKRQLSRENLSHIASRLSIPSLELLPTRAPKPSYHKLSVSEENQMLTDWCYFAVFSLARMKNNKAAPEWISRRLGISVTQAKRALNCLRRLNLIDVRGEKMILLKENFETTTDIPSEILRRFHAQNLKRALMSLERDPVKRRDMTSMTLAFADKDIDRAKEYIWKFSEKFCKKFESSNGHDVYTIAVQLFPQTVEMMGATNAHEDSAT